MIWFHNKFFYSFIDITKLNEYCQILLGRASLHPPFCLSVFILDRPQIRLVVKDLCYIDVMNHTVSFDNLLWLLNIYILPNIFHFVERLSRTFIMLLVSSSANSFILSFDKLTVMSVSSNVDDDSASGFIMNSSMSGCNSTSITSGR